MDVAYHCNTLVDPHLHRKSSSLRHWTGDTNPATATGQNQVAAKGETYDVVVSESAWQSRSTNWQDRQDAVKVTGNRSWLNGPDLHYWWCKTHTIVRCEDR
ncbi:MAG: hypothetical protein ACLTJ8_07615 [Veillonella atypica]